MKLTFECYFDLRQSQIVPLSTSTSALISFSSRAPAPNLIGGAVDEGLDLEVRQREIEVGADLVLLVAGHAQQRVVDVSGRQG